MALSLVLQIIVGDAIAYMQDYIKEGRLFDYVFADLTDVPISPTPRGELWDFMRTVIGSGTKLIQPTGKYMTHVSMQCFWCMADKQGDGDSALVQNGQKKAR